MTVATARASYDERRALVRDRVMQQFVQQSHYDPMGDAFEAGWNAALEFVAPWLQTPGADGCYCNHHPDDPAHTKDCYDITKVL